MFLMEHLHCMACLVPLLRCCCCCCCFLLLLIGLGGIEGFLDPLSAICDLEFSSMLCFFWGSKAWRYGHVFSSGRGALQDRASVGQMERMENK